MGLTKISKFWTGRKMFLCYLHGLRKINRNTIRDKDKWIVLSVVETELQIFPLLLSVPLKLFLSLFPGYNLSSWTGSLMFDLNFSVKTLSMLRRQMSGGGWGMGG